MRASLIATWLAATLLLCSLTGWQAYRKGKESLEREQMMDIIEDNRAAMQEVRAAYSDFSAVISAIRTQDQQRIAEGERRREAMQKAVQNDTCADVHPPATVTEQLLRHIAHVENQTRLRAGAGGTHEADTDPLSGRAGYLVPDNRMERPVAGRTGYMQCRQGGHCVDGQTTSTTGKGHATTGATQ